MLINEIFTSIQGESSYAGLPCIFIRLSGCNLSCSYCDTLYAHNNGSPMSIPDIINLVKSFNMDLVEITGGEPLLQEEISLLVDELLKEGLKILIETNGSMDISKVSPLAVRIMDIKCPGSGMSNHMDWGNIKRLNPGDEVKFVIGDREDFLWSLEKIKSYELQSKSNILFSCIYGKLEPHILAKWILEERINVRFQIQLHKYVKNLR